MKLFKIHAQVKLSKLEFDLKVIAPAALSALGPSESVSE